MAIWNIMNGRHLSWVQCLGCTSLVPTEQTQISVSVRLLILVEICLWVGVE